MKWILGLLALTTTAGISHAYAMPSPFSRAETGVALSDEVLSAQRGKFVAGSMPHYFGIEFITTITSPGGSMLSSGMQLNINRNRSSIGVNVYKEDYSTTVQDISSDKGVSSNSPNGSGLVQLAQIAGNSNTGTNDFSVVKGEMTPKGISLEQSHYQLSLPDGQVRFEFTPSTMGMSVTSNDGRAMASQMVRNQNNNQGFVQQFHIAGDNQLLSNQAKIYMGDKLSSYTDLAQTMRQQLPMGFK